MRKGEVRREYLLAQALTYIMAGLFLISYSDTVQARSFIFIVGIILCGFAFINVIVVTFIPKYIPKMELVDTFVKTGLLPITFVALFIHVIETRDKSYFELRLFMTFGWVLIAMFSMIVGIFRVMSSRIKTGSGKKGFFYRLFVLIGLFTADLGILLIFLGIFNPETAESLAGFNKWLYNPMIHFAIALICVFPILILTPDEDDEDDKF